MIATPFWVWLVTAPLWAPFAIFALSIVFALVVVALDLIFGLGSK